MAQEIRDDALTVVVVAACPFPQPRGTPVRIQRIAEALADRGHRVHVVAYPYGKGQVAASVAVHRGPGWGRPADDRPGPSARKLVVLDPLLTITLARTLRRLRPDVIHAHHAEGLLAAVAARLGMRVPIVYDAHTLIASELPSYQIGLPRGLKRSVGEHLDRVFPALCEHIVGVTQTICDWFVDEAGVPANRVSLVTNGVEFRHFQACSAPRTDTPTIVFAGNLGPYQGIDLLVRACRQVLDRRPDARLLIISGSSFAPYEALARELGVLDRIDVRAADFETLPALLAEADVAVNPRPNCAGIPLKLLNYLAAGRPVVSFANSAPGLRHGETAWLVEDGDSGGLGRGILTLLADRDMAERLGERGRRHVEAHHTWDRMGRLTEDVYRDVIGRGRTTAR